MPVLAPLVSNAGSVGLSPVPASQESPKWLRFAAIVVSAGNPARVETKNSVGEGPQAERPEILSQRSNAGRS